MDWGIGGFSVYQALRRRSSTADILYFSDAGTTPYGKLSRDALRARFADIAEFFRRRRVEHVLVACHSASSALEPDPASELECISGVAFRSIIPAAVRVAWRSAAARLGVIGGNLTIQSGVYERALGDLAARSRFCPAQPLSAFVEAGELDSPAVEAEVRRILANLPEIDALLIACTHYPALAPVFARVAPNLRLVDPGADLAASVQEHGSSTLEFFTTGDRAASVRSIRLAFAIDVDANGGPTVLSAEK
jgi:glutamate racemase